MIVKSNFLSLSNPKTKKPSSDTLTCFLSIIIFAVGSVCPIIKCPCRNFPVNSIAIECVGIKQKIKKPEFSNNLNYEIIEENFVNNTNIKSNENFADKKEILAQNESVEPIKKMLDNADTILKTKKTKDNFQESTNNKINELSAKANIRDPKTEMVLKSSGNSWVEIEDMNGSILFARLMRPGETFIVPNINGLTINTGNAGVLSLSQGNSFLAKLGDVGEIITAKPLNIKSFSNITNIN